MLKVFVYAAQWKSPAALPKLLALLPEPAQSEARKLAADCAGLTERELAQRIIDARLAELQAAERAMGRARNCPPLIFTWMYVKHIEGARGK